MAKSKVTTTYEDGYLSEAIINDHTVVTYISGSRDETDDRISILPNQNDVGLSISEVKELVSILNKMLKGL
jgi:hypothetical protein